MLTFQWFSGWRVAVECAFQDKDGDRSWSHSGLRQNSLPLADCMTHIRCARHNATIIVHPNDLPAAFHFGDFHDAVRNNARFLLSMHDDTEAREVFSFRPGVIETPGTAQKELWDAILKIMPTDLGAIDRALSPIAQKHIRATVAPARLSNLIDYSRAETRHRFPDKRALALVKSHFVLLVKIGPTQSERIICLQAHVHPSVRGNLTHYPFICISLDPPPNELWITEGRCSCDGGCAQRFVRCLTLLGATGHARTCRHCWSH